MMEENILEVKNLETSFFTHVGEVKAVRGVSFSVKKGEILGIVGESGSGKSVSLMSMMQLIEHPGKIKNGEVFFEGNDLLKKKEKEMLNVRGKEIAMIFQDPMSSLNPVYRIGNQIIESILYHDKISKAEARKRAVELLKMVGIPSAEERLNSYPHEFSGGQRQRIGIARALAVNPEFLFCDEPISALDVSIQAQIMNLLMTLQKERHLTMLFIAHDLAMVKHISDNIGVMYLGKLVEISPAAELYEKPYHPYTQALLESIPIADPDLAKSRGRHFLTGDVPSPIDPPKGCRFCGRCSKCMDICLEVRPELKEVSKGHQVACHLYDD